ncbi:MAG: efflux RND transporter permease subunit [Verrucomicrobiaceae bacterium]|nr:efflux RND transporter permease subunit [Verrucomicrobiaceae bacterium]
MSLYKISVQRPVLASVMSIIIVIFGAVSFERLGVREFPAVDPPIISVSTIYTGAAPEVIESQITEPLEENLNAVAGIRSLTSVSREGRSTITVEFDIGADLEVAANDVRDKVARAQRDLPPDADPPTVTKSDADRSPVAFVSVYSPSRDLLELSSIADRRFKPILQTIPGVSEISIWGEKRYAMRIWLDRDKLSSFDLTAVDVRDALDRENVELPSGRVDGNQVELSVRAVSRFTKPEEFNEMVIRESEGRVVRLQDVGYASIGPENVRNLMKRNGTPAVGVVLRPQPGANQIAIADEMYRRLELIRKDLPEDIQASVGFDLTQYVRASIIEVVETILLAVGLVVLIIFAFLRTVRSTLVPAVVIPISLIGGFFIMYLAGYSINVLTLLAMVLSIGLVVDDTIIVLENIYAKLEQGMSAKAAAIEGTREVFFAVIATTVALVAVFAPILFLGGLVGKLFQEFAVVIAGTVIISAFVALTLAPMLCSKILQDHSHSRFYYWTEPVFERMTAAYRWSLTGFMRMRWLAFPVVLLSGVVIVFLFQLLPTELAPLEDRSRLRVSATAPEGASFEYMLDYMDQLSEMADEEVPEIDTVISQTSPGYGGSSSVNSGFLRIYLKDRGERERSQAEIAEVLNTASRNLTGSRVVVSQDSTISLGPGAGSRLSLQFVVQAQDSQKLEEKLPEFMEKVEATGAFNRVDVDLKFNKPELRVNIDRERAQSMGVSAEDIGQTLNLALAEQRFGYFLQEGKQYFVVGALVREDRDENLDLRNLTVPSRSHGPVRMDNVVTLTERVSSPRLYRFNRYSAATVSASPKPGVSLGQGIEIMEEVAREVLDESFETDLAGEARELRETSSRTLFAFLFALALIYFILAAQFESFRDPLVILFTVPLALSGALGALVLFEQTLNIFSQIGIIMLIGLVTKNGILIVEFANQQREKGLGIREAVTEAAAARFRPVLMTSFSTVLGILPIALALGAGSESRRSMGIAVVGGLLVGTFLTLFVIPALYTFFASREHGRFEVVEGETVKL